MDSLLDFLINIPKVVASFGDWLTEPLDVINMSPLALLGIAGVSVIVSIIGIHIVRLFVG